MRSLEAELETARELDTEAIAEAIVSIGFECTRCGACCKGYVPDEAGEGDPSAGNGQDAGTAAEREPHTATVFPDEVRRLLSATGGEWRDVARPMPYGLTEREGEPEGETFEWALRTDACGDCTFYREDGGVGACTVHGERPLICQTYPFSVALGGTTQPMGEAVDEVGIVRAHECEGLGREISPSEATDLARTLKRRAIRELEEAIAVRERYEPADAAPGEVVVHDSEGQKRADGTARDP